MAYGQEDPSTGSWRARYKRPDGTIGSKSGFPTKDTAEGWAKEQEALIRRSMWLDPRDAETRFGDFAEEWLDAVRPRLALNTVAKYRSFLDIHLLPQWAAWPLIGIFNGYVEIERWLSELHEDYADSSVSSIFAAFSTVLSAAVRARMIPANPCAGVRVSSGEFESEKLVASPAQALRAAMRLYECGLGAPGFVLCLMDFYTGGRWGELVGQQRHEYDAERRRIEIRMPLKEVGGKVFKGSRPSDEPRGSGRGPEPTRPPGRRDGGRKGRGKKGRTKTPAGTRFVALPPSIAVFYEELMDSHSHPFVLCTPEGFAWRRSNFRIRYWRPVWDGVDIDDPGSRERRPAILPTFTFHEGRHTHSTWLAEDGIPEAARRARLGQKMRGMARIYDHVTPAMVEDILRALERRWRRSLAALRPGERDKLVSWFPHLLSDGKLEPGPARLAAAPEADAISTPSDD
jgi:integrase